MDGGERLEILTWGTKQIYLLMTFSIFLFFVFCIQRVHCFLDRDYKRSFLDFGNLKLIQAKRIKLCNENKTALTWVISSGQKKLGSGVYLVLRGRTVANISDYHVRVEINFIQSFPNS